MNRKIGAILILAFLSLFFSISHVYAPEDNTIELSEFDDYLADRIGIPLFAAQILCSVIVMGLFMFPTLVLTQHVGAHLVMGLGTMGFCIAIGWLPYWFLFILSFIIALMYGGKMRDWISGGQKD